MDNKNKPGVVKKGLFKHQQVKAGFLHMFGSLSYGSLIFVCLTMIVFGWCGDSLWALITEVGNVSKPWELAVGLFVFPVTIGIWLWWLKKNIQKMNKPAIRETIGISECKVLIVYLSTLGADRAMLTDLLQDKNGIPENGIIERTFREKFTRGWRMPLEAIAHHRKRDSLERVFVIPSKDSCSRQQDGTFKPNPGTFTLVPDFKELVERGTGGQVEVGDLNEVDERWSTGVDYENAGELCDCFSDLFSWLQRQGYKSPAEVVVDITSGQKVGSSVAMVMSLESGRKVQYVSTNDYTLKSYDITYETE